MSPKICNNCKNLLLLLTTCFKLAIAASWAIRYPRTPNRVSSANLTFKQFSRWRLNVLTLQFYLFCSRLLLSSSPPSVCFKLNRLRALKKNIQFPINRIAYLFPLLIPWNWAQFEIYVRIKLACEQQTHFRSSLLSLRKIAIFRRERSDDRKCVCCSQARIKYSRPN